ncbi:MAG: hypothetical protein K0Q95_3299 [Bacteroidota bacterium]|jgi:TatD DNase family protein|nr:hypothetical protein [Bacteroidota bacterium]
MVSPVPFINIHTHSQPEEGTVAIVDAGMGDYPNGIPVSVGIHPWYINKYDKTVILEKLFLKAQRSEVLAIGECGLDKFSEVSMEVQEYFFREQIKIAEKVNKPMIIHCVKAFDGLFKIKKESKTTVPFIVHGYNNNDNIAKQLLENGVLFSFGKALLNEGSNAEKLLHNIESNSFFLETDNATVSIMSIFEKAATLRKVSVEELKEQMLLNFKSIFKYG